MKCRVCGTGFTYLNTALPLEVCGCCRFVHAGLVPLAPTRGDYEWAWRAAFAYADARTATEFAVAFAEHYLGCVRGETDLLLWPGVEDVFTAWVKNTLACAV